MLFKEQVLSEELRLQELFEGRESPLNIVPLLGNKASTSLD